SACSSSANRIERSREPQGDAVLARRFKPRLQLQLRRIELRCDVTSESRHQRVLAPFGARRQSRERRARLASFAYAFERLVVAVFDQRIEAGCLRIVVQQIAAEDLQQSR